MSRLLKLGLLLFLAGFVFAAPTRAQNIGSCPDTQKIKQNANGWLYQQPGFKPPNPPPPPALYDPYIKNNYPKNAHRDTSMLPNPEAIACLIAYAKQEWHDDMGTNFDEKGVNQVIDFAVSHQFNPSLLLALWSEESHGGDRSVIELGCGNVNSPGNYHLSGQFNCLANDLKPEVLNNNFACFMGGYAGDTPTSLNCGYGDPNGTITNPDFWVVMQFYNYLTNGVTPNPNPPLSFNFGGVQPLRPNPKEGQQVPDPKYLTTYCAMRPIPVELDRLDYTGKDIPRDIKTIGPLTQDFSEFITPLLSVTNPNKPDYNLPYNDKAQRYLADYLEGRAYYEPQAEPANPTTAQQADLFNRLGVWRKLAPKTYQDELKRAIIQRAGGTFDPNNNPYGFDPASTAIHNYTVGFWQGKTVTLKDFIDHWAPLPKDFPDNTTGYQQAYDAWLVSDGGKWYALWPYVPMFTREDSIGRIDIYDSNPPPAPYTAGSGYVEDNHTNKKSVEVSHPHLARTYEVSTAISYLLTPQQNHDAVPAQPTEEWSPKRWEDSIWWLDPSLKTPHLTAADIAQVGLGNHCDFKAEFVKPISTSGDTATDSQFTTATNRVDVNVTVPPFNDSKKDGGLCGQIYWCDQCIEEEHRDRATGHITISHRVDHSACIFYKQVRSNPNYLVTYTPFLNEIFTSLSQSKRAIFDIFKPAGTPQRQDEEYDWPGIGNAGEESPKYDFKPVSGEQGWAEAGDRKPGDSQSYWYRYLGSIQCAKERVMQVLQPFISGDQYKPYAYECFPELTPENATGSAQLPTGPKWLQWPMKNVGQPLTQCFKDTSSSSPNTHAGIDMVGSPAAAPVFPGAPGKVVNVSFSSVFGNFVIIHHDNNWNTIYAHLQPNILVSRGDTVNTGTKLGYQDSTGTPTYSSPMQLHLHFGLSKGSSEADFYFTSSAIADPCAAIAGCTCANTGH